MPMSARKARTLRYFQSKSKGWFRSRTLSSGADYNALVPIRRICAERESLKAKKEAPPPKPEYPESRIDAAGWARCTNPGCRTLHFPEEFKIGEVKKCRGCHARFVPVR